MKKTKYNRYIDYVNKYGVKELFQKISYKLSIKYHKEYSERIGAINILAQKNTVFEYEPVISIIVPVYNVQEKYFLDMLTSVLNQTYSKWELCIADASESYNIGNIINAYEDNRIKYLKVEDNLGIAANTNKALELASGDYIALLDHDDMLSIDALYEVVNAININGSPEVLYSDEDKVREDNIHVEPYRKPSYNYDLLQGNNYICHLFVVKRSLAMEINGFRSEYDGAQDYDFIIRCVSCASRIIHIDKVLYHWRIHKMSVAANPESKLYAYEAGKKAIESWLEKENLRGRVLRSKNHLGCYMVKYEISGNPLVSIILHGTSGNNTCMKIIEKSNTYTNVEIIMADKDIQDGLKKAKGEYVILLNNNINTISKGFVEKLLSLCQRNNTACVSGKIVKGSTIIQAGININEECCEYSLNGYNRKSTGLFYSGILRRNVDATSATLMMVKKSLLDKYIFSKDTYCITKEYVYNNKKIKDIGIDISNTLKNEGYLVVVTPDVEVRLIQGK